MPRGRPRQFNTDTALEAALLLFWRYGYEGTSLEMLTKAMGINVPSLYAAFGNKEALFKKTLARYMQRPASYLPRALTKNTAREAVETLYEGAIGMVMKRGHPDGCLLVHGALAAGPAGEPIRRELAEWRTRAEMAVRRRLERAIAEGDLGAHVNARKLAKFVVTVVWGMSVQAAGGATRGELREVARVAMDAWPCERNKMLSEI